jgi:hypothetical protein
MFRLAEPLSSIQSRLCEQSKFLKAGADSGTMWAAFEAAECTAHIASSVSVCLSPNGLQWQEVRSQCHGGVVPNRLAEGVAHVRGFGQAPTSWRSFQRKTGRNRPLDGELGLPRRAP